MSRADTIKLGHSKLALICTAAAENHIALFEGQLLSDDIGRVTPLAQMNRAGIEMFQPDIDISLGIGRVHPHSNVLGDVAELGHLPAGFQGLRAHLSILSSKAAISSGWGNCPLSSLGRVLVIS